MPGQFTYPGRTSRSGRQDRIYVADTGNNRVQIFNADGTFYAAFGEAGDAPIDEDTGEALVDLTPDAPGEFNYPSGVAVDALGNVLVVESDNHRMELFTAQPGGRHRSAVRQGVRDLRQLRSAGSGGLSRRRRR